VKQTVAAASLAVAAMLAATPVAAAPARDALISPGRGIGRVTVGMTRQQVQAALGRHTFVSRRRNLGLGEQYLELQWGYATWTVGFQGRPGRLRVVLVGTTLRRQRTRERLGAGSHVRDIVRAYPRATCSDWAGLGTNSSKERWIVVTHPSGSRTIFAAIGDMKPSPSPVEVVEVMVQRPARGLAERRSRCPANWRRQ
jgi:hypothetical protein